MEITDRLHQIIDYLGITSNAFAVKIGISQPRMSNYLKGRVPDYDTLYRVCKTFVVINPAWLLTGEGEMLKPSSQSQSGVDGDPGSETAEHIRELTEIIRTQARALLEQQQFINAHLPGSIRDAGSPPLAKDD